MSEISHTRPGHEGLIPYLIVTGAAEAIDFYAKAFGADEIMRLPMPGGAIGHAEMTIDGSPFYLADTSPQMEGGPTLSPGQAGATTVILHRYVPDCDAATERAKAAGATVLREPADQFYGERAATVQDPYGHQWSLHTRTSEVSMEEMVAKMQGGDAA